MDSWFSRGEGLPDELPDPPHLPADFTLVKRSILEALLTPETRPAFSHPRVTQVLRLLAGRMTGDVSLKGLAARVELSPGRLSHLFRRQVGLGLRGYVRWRRMQTVASAVRAGMSLTEAAHEAGFSDSAHLSRTFRRMLGVRPSTLLRTIRWSA